MKYIDAYRRCILPRYILQFCFGNSNSRDFLNVIFSRFHNCFLPFPLVFPHVSPGVSTARFGVFSAVFHLFRILDFAGLQSVGCDLLKFTCLIIYCV